MRFLADEATPEIEPDPEMHPDAAVLRRIVLPTGLAMTLGVVPRREGGGDDRRPTEADG